MKLRRILVDCDGVLSDFVTPALRVVAELGGPVINHDEMDRYELDSYLSTTKQREKFWHAVCAEGFCASLQPYPGAQDAITELRKRVDVHVCFGDFLGERLGKTDHPGLR